VRRHADRQRHGTLGTTGLAAFDGALDSSLGTGDHHLARGVEVHRADHFALRRFGTGGQHVGIFQTEDGSHAALPRRNGFLHQLATALDELYRVRQAQAARSNQCAVFTQAVTGNECRTRATFSQPQTPQGD